MSLVEKIFYLVNICKTLPYVLIHIFKFKRTTGDCLLGDINLEIELWKSLERYFQSP